MPRTLLTRTAKPNPYGAALQVVTMTALDNTNGNAVSFTGDEVIIFHNPTGGAVTVTIRGSADPQGRIDDMVLAMAAGSFARCGPLGVVGWRQSDMRLYIDSSAPGVTCAVLAVS
jgi:hypothetical protein